MLLKTLLDIQVFEMGEGGSYATLRYCYTNFGQSRVGNMH